MMSSHVKHENYRLISGKRRGRRGGRRVVLGGRAHRQLERLHTFYFFRVSLDICLFENYDKCLGRIKVFVVPKSSQVKHEN
jgi:hypothetical protein